MIHLNPLSTLAILMGVLSLLVAVLTVADRLSLWKKKANARLAPLYFYWDEFRLFEIPRDAQERETFFVRRGQNAGVANGVMMSGGGAAALIGLVILAQWCFYPAAKKEALRALAGEGNLSEGEVQSLAACLR